eukprot:COSAG01_NODE_1524_length_10019_cov_6.258367_17_plen_66_part_00
MTLFINSVTYRRWLHGRKQQAQFYTNEFKYSTARFERLSDEVIAPEFARHLHILAPLRTRTRVWK